MLLEPETAILVILNNLVNGRVYNNYVMNEQEYLFYNTMFDRLTIINEINIISLKHIKEECDRNKPSDTPEITDSSDAEDTEEESPV